MSGTITHEWNGTVLTITSDSGTSSADLKGTKGDTGARGVRGLAGADGITSVNGKKGDITLTASDVGAEESGTAENVRTQIEAWVEDGYLPLTGGTLTGNLGVNGIITAKTYLAVERNSNPQLALKNANSKPLAVLYTETSDGSYGHTHLQVYKSATESNTFTFGNNGNINVPGTVNLGSALSISSGGTGATTASGALANLGAASSTLVRGQMKTFTIAGDKEHYYPVVFNVHSEYFVNRIAITRSYNDTAPDDWGTDTSHKGGLTFQFQWNGDNYWGGNGTSTSLKVETLFENYCKMVGGMKLSTSGVVVWLRGGSALYKVLNEMGSAMSITPYYDTFTDDAGNSFPVRTYDASVVDSEIQQRLVFYPLTGGNLLGKLYASGEISGTQLYSKTNNYPQLTLQNNSGANLAMLYANTTTGDYSSVYLCVYSSASSYSTFNFGNDGKLSCGSLALTSPLTVGSGGTGAASAAGARSNVGGEYAKYATAEIDTGNKWIDGKTIYRAVVYGTTSISNSLGEVGTLPSEVETPVNIRAYAKGDDSAWRVIPNAYHGNSTWDAMIYINGKTIVMSFGSSWTKTRDFVVIVEYTK